MKMKRILSSVAAAAVAFSAALSDWSAVSLNITAGAEASVYAYTYEETTHTLNVSSSTEDASGLYVSGNTDISIDGLTKGVTTFGELMELYSGLTIEGFTMENCSVDGLTEDDFEMYIFMMYGDSWTWYQTSGPEITFSEVGADSTAIVRALGYVLRLKESTVATTELAEGDTVRVNYDDSLEYYTYEISNENMTMTVEESEYTNSGLSATYYVDFEIPGVEYGVTTVGELKEMYCGYNIKGYSFEGSSIESMTESDLVPTVVMMTGNYAWNAVYSTTTMDFSTGLPNAAASDVVLTTSFHLSVNDESFAALGLEVGDSITVNPVESNGWQANFVYDETTGQLSWGNISTDSTGKITYKVYANGTDIGGTSTTVTNGVRSTPSIVPVVELANYDMFAVDTAASLTGELEITVCVDGGDTAEGSYKMSYDGCDTSSLVSVPTNVALDADGDVVWDAVDNAVGFIFRAGGDGIITYGINNHGNENYTSDWGMATLCMSGNGVDDCTVEIYAVDINGDVSEAFTSLYSELSVPEWEANFVYDSTTGKLSWDNCTDVEENAALGYPVYANDIEIGSAWAFDFGDGDTSPSFALPLELAEYNINNNNSLTGELTITVSTLDYSTTYPYMESSDSYTYNYDGCSVNSNIAAPASVRIYENGTDGFTNFYDENTKFSVSWNESDGAIGYIYQMLNGDTLLSSFSGSATYDSGTLYYLAIPADGTEVTIRVCAVDVNGDRSEFSEVTYTIGDTPENGIYFDNNGTLYWNAVDGADHYLVKVSNGTVSAEDNCLSNNSSNYSTLMAYAGFAEGTYQLEIYSVTADGTESLVGSIDYEFTGAGVTVGENIFTYTDNTDGTITITGGNIVTAELEIPAELDGKKVTEIGTQAFAFNSVITKLTIPEGVKKLGWYAFNNCTNLTEVTLPESLEYIDSWAFERCSKLETIHIPANVSTVMGGAFAQNPSMTSITCDKNNKYYTSVDGVLFTKDMSELNAYPGGIQGAYTVPASVDHIGDAAFYGATGLEAVTILGALDFIGFEAFAECSQLTDVKINDGVNYVGYWAFRGCDGIKQLTVPQSVTNIGDQAFGYADYENNKNSSFALRGYKDSAVYFYAIRHDIPFICIGEADTENMPFDTENPIEGEVETDPNKSEDEQIKSLILHKAFNMKDKSEAGVGLDLTDIQVKAKEIYDDDDAISRAENALGTDIGSNKNYNLLDITLVNGNNDISQGYDGLVEILIPIPKGHREKDFYCYRMVEDADGNMTKELIPGVRKSEEYYAIYLEHFSLYAFVYSEEHTCSFSENWSNDSENHWHECSCGEKNESAAHTASDWVTEIEATQTENGKKYKDCTVCGYILETAEIPATGTEDTDDNTAGGNTGSGSAGGSTGGSSGGSSGGSYSGGSSSGSSGGAVSDGIPTVNGERMNWSQTANKISAMSENDTVVIEMNGGTDIPEIAMQALAKSGANAVFKYNSLISWEIDGEDIEKAAAADLDVTYPVQINTIALDGKAELKFRIDDTNAPTTFVYSFGKEYAGRTVSLYKKSESGVPELVAAVKVSEDGAARFALSAKGDYALMLMNTVMGDVTNDGRINALDAAAILRDIVGVEPALNPAARDYNGDGAVNALDASAILIDIVNGKAS